MTTDWSIQSRAHSCAATERPFAEGEYFYTLLFVDKSEFRREDLCEEAFSTRDQTTQPFSYWRSKYTPPPPPEQEAVTKQTAEDLLRSYMEETDQEHSNARYILALMLERKRILKEVEVKRDGDGSLTRIYEHPKTGEVFIIPDPQLKLSQVAEIQAQVADLLGAHPKAVVSQTEAAPPDETEPSPS